MQASSFLTRLRSKIKRDGRRLARSSVRWLFFHRARIFHLAPSGIRILCYHRISDSELPYVSASVASFSEQMALLASHGFRTVSLDDVLQRRCDGNPIVITFDDGYLDTFENAFPILNRHGFRATVFCVADFLGQPSYLSVDQVKEMHRAGYHIGSHTLSHPHLSQLAHGEMENQIKGSKRRLEDQLAIPVDFFCYPYGEFDPVIVDIVRRAGYRGACSCIPGLNTEVDPYLMRRTMVVPHDSASQFERKLGGAYDPLEEALYAARRYLRKHGRFSPLKDPKAATVSDPSLPTPSP